MSALVIVKAVLLRVPLGLWRIACAINHWRLDAANEPHYEAALAASPARYMQLRETHDQRIRQRGGALLALVGMITGVLLAVEILWLGTIIWTYAAATILGASAIAGPKKKTRHEESVIIAKEERPGIASAVSADAIVKAFTVAMPAVKRALEADSKALALIGPVTRDGPGWSATVDLPPAMTTLDCVRAHENLASALRVMGDQLYLTPGRHAGQCHLWISDARPEEMAEVGWPHAHQQSLSLVEPVTIGSTMKGSPVTLSFATKTGDGKTIAGGSMLVGGVSGSGKTTFMRLVVTAAALHPDATIAIFDGKGDRDYSALEPVCDWYRVGASPQHLADLHTMLTEAQEIMAARQKGRAEKTPLLIVIDEVQRVKDKDTQAVIEDLLRIGRSAGIFVVLATQKPSAETLPTDLRDSVRTRVCLRVPNQATNDMILGTGAYSEGRDATKFTRGMGLVMDVDTDAVDLVRVANVTDTIAGRIATAQPREPGQMFTDPRSTEGADEETTGSEDESAVPEIVELVRSVWPEGRDRASCAELAEALGWADGAEVTRRLKAEAGIVAASIRIGGSTPKGVYWAQVAGQAGMGRNRRNA